jgi:hypothetical protein
VEPMKDDILTEDVNRLYRTTTDEEDYIDPIADDLINWRSISSCASNFDTRLETWKQQLHELSTRRCS